MPAPVYITGIGFISSIGNNCNEVWQSIEQHRSGIEAHSFLPDDHSRIRAAGTIKGFRFPSPGWPTWEFPQHIRIPRELLRGLAPHGVFAYAAIEEAFSVANLSRDAFANDRSGLFCASAGSPYLMNHHIQEMNNSRGRRGNPMGIINSISGTLNFNFGAFYQIKGATLGFVSACASSSHAIGYAMDEIRLGRHDRMLVVGAEDFCAESILPFAAMRALSNTEGSAASRPFDLSRDGFVGTGGATALILESELSVTTRKASPIAILSGWGQASDGQSVAVSDPDGEGLATAMHRALRDAGLQPADVDYINAHATSTVAGDLSEARAIEKVFAPVRHPPLTSSTKGLTGHGLSLSGALEAGITALCIQNQLVPGNANLQTIDPQCQYLNLPHAPLKANIRHAISNSSGFGGSNVCLVFKSPHP